MNYPEYTYENTRRICYTGGATFVPVCSTCGRYVKADTTIKTNDSMSDLETNDLVARWKRAKQREEECQRAQNSSSCELANATNALGKWLTPKDSRQGEKFHIWYYGQLIEATEKSHGDYIIKIRAKREEVCQPTK